MRISDWSSDVCSSDLPTRVVVRPFHLAWQASGPDLVRVQRLARDITSLDMHTVRSELAAVLRDFADRHWQIEKVFEDIYVEIVTRLGLLGLVLITYMHFLLGAIFYQPYSFAVSVR